MLTARSYRQHLLLFSASALVALALPGAAARAQTASTTTTTTTTTAPLNLQASNAATPVEEVVVTGSRLKRANLESISPVVTVTSAEIQAKGLTNIQDVLNQLPEIGAPGNSNVSNNFTDENAGINTINLRNLGDSRTLVLIDGRRVVGGVPPGSGSAAVDISTIPAYLVEKVDVVTGGAGAVYGSEAVAGVVNIKLRDHYDGVLLNEQYGVSKYGDSQTTTTDLLAGTDFAGGKGHAILAVDYQDQGSVRSSARGISQHDTFNGAYTPSSYSEYGRFSTTEGNVEVLDNGGIAPASNAYGFNRDALRTIQIPTSRLAFYTKADYDITDDVSFYTSASFARTTATSLLEPIAIGNAATTIGFQGETISMPYSYADGSLNPFIPASLIPILKTTPDANLPGVLDVASWRKRFYQLGNRGDDVQRDNFEITEGLKGTILDRFDWNVHYSYGETNDTVTEANSGNALNLQNALEAYKDPVTGVIECYDPVARAEGCQPLNLFGRGTASQAALNYIRAVKTYTSQVSEGDVGGDIGGDIFQLPYGGLRLDIGFEHRREDGFNQPDALTAQGIGLDTSGPATRGGYADTDFFAETVVPILKDLPFAKSLSISAGYRHSDYSLSAVGSQDNYNYGIAYAPIPDIQLHADNAVVIRAPNITELYQGRSQSAVSVTDPCSDQGLASAPNPGLRAAKCAQIPGITPGFTENIADQQTEISYQEGNPDLTAERAKVLTYGVTLAPRFIPKFTTSVDAFKYDIQNAIQPIGIQDAADQCVDTGLKAFCDLVRRNPTTGIIQGVDSKVINVGQNREQGIDVQMNYELDVPSIMHPIMADVSPAGAIDFTWNYEYLQYLNYVAQKGAAKVPQQSLFDAPKNRWTADALYRDEKLQLNYQLRYTGEQRYAYKATGAADPGGPAVSGFFYSDVSVRYQLTPKIAPYFGINNVFDKKPPLVDQAFAGGNLGSTVTGTETVANVYDPIGRFFYFGIKVGL